MKEKMDLAHSIIELNIAKKDVRGITKTISYFQIKSLPAEIWYAITEKIDYEDLVIELACDLELQKDFMRALEQHGYLKNLVFFGQAFGLIKKEAILQAAQLALNDESREAGEALLFAAEILQSSKEAITWAKKAKEIAFAAGDPETFLEACDFLKEEPLEEDLLDLINREVKILIKQQKNKDPGNMVLKECRKCLTLLRQLPKETGESLKKLIFE
jgi:hypothetical protein